MIKLLKIEEPQILRDNSVKWTSDLMDDFAVTGVLNKDLQKKYNHPQIKSAVETETSGKCAYCESYVSHVYPGDIEHIIPKSIVPESTFKWENLTYCCFECNNKKRAYHDDAYPIINPYVDNIGEHLIAIGSTYFAAHGSSRGLITREMVNLNRIELIGRRQEKIEILVKFITDYHNETIPLLKDIKLAEINGFINKSEFTNTLKTVYNSCI